MRRRPARPAVPAPSAACSKREWSNCPPQHRREGGPPPAKPASPPVAAPEIRRTLGAYLDVRAAVLRPKTIDKLTSALAIFGEFICDHDPELARIADLERRHIEAFLAWTATRSRRGSHDRTRPVGPFVHAHAAIAVRGFLDDITAWGWADAPGPAADVRQPTSPATRLAAPRPATRHRRRGRWPPSPHSTTSSPASGSPCCAAPACGSASSSISSSTPSSISATTAPGCVCRSASSTTNACVPLDDTTLAALDEWLAQRSPQRPGARPRDGHPPTSSSSNTADASAPPASSGPPRRRGHRRAHRPRRKTACVFVAHQLRHT